MLSFEQLRDLVRHCTTPGRSELYRKLYGLSDSGGPMTIESWDDWHALPVLTKDFLSSFTLKERTFVPLNELDHVRVSSGTTGGTPLFLPRTRERGSEFRLGFHDYERPLLSFTAPMTPHWHEYFLKAHGKPGRVIVFDPLNPEASIRLASAVGVDSISAFTYQMQRIGELMTNVGMNDQIRCIDISGERCSRAQLHAMRHTFPNAKIFVTYGASEMDDPDAGIPCRPLDEPDATAYFHAKSTHYLEMVDPENGAPVDIIAGAEGDVLVSAYPGEPSAFPLIRLRLGDTIQVMEDHCADHRMWTYTVMGRTDHDFVRVPGGLIRVDEIERIIAGLSDRVTDNFTLHVIESADANGPRLGADLEIELIGSPDLDALAREIAAHLRINPELTWEKGVAEGRLLPLTCRPLIHNALRKHRRIVRG